MAELRRFFIPAGDIKGDTAAICGEEFIHMVQVLRHRVGDRVVLLPGNGEELIAELTAVNRESALAKIISRRVSGREPAVALDLFQAVCKGEKMELIAQKAVELGVRRIYPFTSCFTVAKDNVNRGQRLNRIASEAVKQCCRAVEVSVEDTISFERLEALLPDYDAAIFCYEGERGVSVGEALRASTVPKRAALIVGSEGGFSKEEAARLQSAGARAVSLGSRILRAETAAIAGLAVCMYEWGEMRP